MPDPHDEIAELEAEIEALAEAAERCRKIGVAAKAAAVAGVLLLVAVAFGRFRLDPLMLVIGIAGVLGGTVLYGSNRSTLQEILDALGAREARRAGLIDELQLPVIDGSLEARPHDHRPVPSGIAPARR
ncbi:hypothetical protein QNA08_16995 [Chelatococcus sp. SYSU_G07232]|uniref:Uncharacterized protein n=2 Tax=Chelatococcus albus TaxID=3047466 RepID=A0ABT7AKL0_9HYPH|nr:hypothetical protein [Chelatococcus sp. SYSU_G07232]